MVYQGRALHAQFCCSSIIPYRKEITRLIRSFFLPSATVPMLLVNSQLPLQLHLERRKAVPLELLLPAQWGPASSKTCQLGTAQEPGMKRIPPANLPYAGKGILYIRHLQPVVFPNLHGCHLLHCVFIGLSSPDKRSALASPEVSGNFATSFSGSWTRAKMLATLLPLKSFPNNTSLTTYQA